MKRTGIITLIVLVAALIALFAFDKITGREKETVETIEVSSGTFEVVFVSTGELMAEKSIDIMAPEIIQRGGPRGGGGDIRGTMMRIQDLVPEGTTVEPGDFVALLDRTEYDNTLKDDYERIASLNTNLDMKILDSAVVLNSIRDDIKNQRYLISEAEMKLTNSKYESPDVIRQAEIGYDKAKRMLEQKLRFYSLRKAQINQDIKNTRWYISRVQSRVDDLEELLKQFTITSPSHGMVIYKRDRRGNKIKTGSMVTPFDRVVATIPDLSVMLSKTYVSEVEVNRVKPGQEVEITIDAFPLKSYKGTVISVGNIGEVLPNSDSKVFETIIRLEGSDPELRPSMTTTNKILISAVENAIYIPTECIRAGADSITFVYARPRQKHIVVTGKSNDKYTLIEQGLKPGDMVYLSRPVNSTKFRLTGEELIPAIRERNRSKNNRAEF